MAKKVSAPKVPAASKSGGKRKPKTKKRPY
jgi:hypothetical protein